MDPMQTDGDREPARARRPWGRIALFLVPGLALVALLTWATLAEGSLPAVGEPVPELGGPLLGGNGSLSLEELGDRPAVVNFWASWCVPCEDEAPILNRAHRLYGDRISFVGVNIKDARDDALAFEERFDVPYPSVRDTDGSLYADFGLTGQPETFLIDSRGILVAHIPGQITQGGFLAALESLAAGR